MTRRRRTLAEIANGDCSNKTAVEDLNGHGTHVASTTIAAPRNGIGIAGVAPDATLVGLKACTIAGFCFADSVAAALRYAGDQQIDVVNLSLFADPYLYYCKSESEQRAILAELESAARYARQQGVVIVSSAGNEQSDLRHPGLDDISPDWPPGSEEERDVENNCRVAPGRAARSHDRIGHGTDRDPGVRPVDRRLLHGRRCRSGRPRR